MLSQAYHNVTFMGLYLAHFCGSLIRLLCCDTLIISVVRVYAPTLDIPRVSACNTSINSTVTRHMALSHPHACPKFIYPVAGQDAAWPSSALTHVTGGCRCTCQAHASRHAARSRVLEAYVNCLRVMCCLPVAFLQILPSRFPRPRLAVSS